MKDDLDWSDYEADGERMEAEQAEREAAKRAGREYWPPSMEDEAEDELERREAEKLAELIKAVKDHAKAHYEDGGWDVIVECWEDQQIVDYLVELEKTATPEEAIEAFRSTVVAVWADRQADAKNSAF